MNEQVKAIRAEIKRLQEAHERNLDKPMERGRIGYSHGVVACCGKILYFIDSLPESNCPKASDNLEEAAEKYEEEHTYQRYDGGGFTPEYDATLAEAFITGATLQKEQMMKDAVEGLICATITGTDAISFLSPLPKELTAGDKVSIIIVKEDNQ